VGRVVHLHSTHDINLEIGDVVLSVATDYREFCKSGFQEYAVVNGFNAVRLPKALYAPRAAAVGVVFVAAAIGLGVGLGLMLPHKRHLQLDLLSLTRAQGREDTREDIVGEVFDSINERPVAGDWVLIYGDKLATRSTLKSMQLIVLELLTLQDRLLSSSQPGVV
jgi:hypothetical protein